MTVRTRRRLLAAVSACVFMWIAVGGAAADQDGRGIDPHQGESLIEVDLPSKAAAMRLQLEAERYGIEFNDHYLRNNADGSVTVTVFGNAGDFAALRDAGYSLGSTIEGPSTWEERIDEYRAGKRAERRSDAAALDNPITTASHEDEIVILRVDYFENYAGRFLSVEAKDRLGSAAPQGSTYIGPTLSLSWNTGPGTEIDSTPRTMSVNIDPDTTPDTYIEHRQLVRIGAPGSADPPRPTRIRIGSSTGATREADVNVWLGGGLPPMGNFLRDFTTRYMDPTEVYAKLDELAAEFPNIAELVPLPYETNGYQRRAQATMAGAVLPGNPVPTAAQGGAVVLTSRMWGHEGGNDITAEFLQPGGPTSPQPNSPLGVSVSTIDNTTHITVHLATDAAGAPSSTAQQVIQAINSHKAARKLVAAVTYRGNAGAGIVEPRAKTPLSDFLTTATNGHVQRGPFDYSVLRIGNDVGKNQGKKVGVFLYCQQHAREWATPLTCLETAEQLLRNYAIHARTRELVNNLDIFILPSSNPDGSHYSMHNFNMQRRNMTNYCVVGGKETDDPLSPKFWTPRVNPGTGAPYVNSDPASRNLWGVDLNRNNTVGTIFDGYIGASYSCTSDVYTGPGEASEPEIKNELWIADTFDNIKFSNNIHSFGGYFMWAPGAYLPDRGEGELVHANIGVEKYFFAAGDRILNRIKDYRGTAILPERTGPIADVLYSAGGNSADEHWYERDVIAYSFETGADRFVDTTLSVAAAAGATGIRAANRTGFGPGDRIRIDAGTPGEEVRTVASVAQPNTPSPQPNVTLVEPLERDHLAGAVLSGGTLRTAVGFQPPYDTEGKHEALEFAAGNFGLLESAFDYAEDETPPEVRMPGPSSSSSPIETTFEYVNEPSVIYYTTNGSRPSERSRIWDSTGPREPGETFHVTRTTTFRWLAKDIKGNESTGSDTFVITGSQ
jgi:Zinc carboxypeptidase/Chitobiase/beta-hexosaminidase C-terminal domain